MLFTFTRVHIVTLVHPIPFCRTEKPYKTGPTLQRVFHTGTPPQLSDRALLLSPALVVSTTLGWLFALADKQMSAAITCMHNDPGHPWTLQKLAGCVGMSRSVFSLRFKETVGATPMEYLTRWRMLLAGDRLEVSGNSISAIASSLGYESESAFGKAFRRLMGCSPRQYSRGCDSATSSHRAREHARGYRVEPVAGD